MNEPDYLLIVCVLVVLICLKIKLTTNYTSKTWDTLRSIVWTLDKPKNVHVHLQSRVNSLDGNLVKILFILT